MQTTRLPQVPRKITFALNNYSLSGEDTNVLACSYPDDADDSGDTEWLDRIFQDTQHELAGVAYEIQKTAKEMGIELERVGRSTMFFIKGVYKGYISLNESRIKPRSVSFKVNYGDTDKVVYNCRLALGLLNRQLHKILVNEVMAVLP